MTDEAGGLQQGGHAATPAGLDGLETERVDPRFASIDRASVAELASLMNEADATARCLTEKVGISALEALPGGGVRLVCMSVEGADHLRRKLKSHLMKGEAVRARHRPSRPLW